MQIEKLIEAARNRDLTDGSALSDYFETVRLLEETNFDEAHRLIKEIRKIAGNESKRQLSSKFLEIYKKALLFDAPYDFDSFMLYVEWDRPSDKRFYLPRRKQLKKVADSLQDLADDKLDLLTISMPPGSGKSTTAIFYLTWLAGKNPEKPILGGSHSNAFLRGVYDECIRIISPEGEYLWKDVFPEVKIIKTNAQDMMIDLGRNKSDGKRFPTFEFSSIGSGNAGKVRAEQLLYCDDLVDGIEAALSKERMDKLWQWVNRTSNNHLSLKWVGVSS